ncbi:MAG TPA: alpha/beta fold hydrolase [Acidimicrobiia bacterium]|nr:alpha/beta fold hydrolase [Acidimicrobiia bacterium]
MPPADARKAAAAARDERIEMVSVAGAELRVSLRPGTAFPTASSPPSASARPPLLLCNGIGAPIEMWSPFRDPLGRPSIAFDAPGVGESSVPLVPPTMAGVARMVLGALDHFDVPTVDVLGVSWGGALAQELAYRGGSRVRRLVLCATMAGGAPIPGDPKVLAILATPLRYWSPSYLDRVAPALYGPDVVGNPEMMAHQRRARFTRAPSGRGYVWQMLALRRFASVLWLHRLRQETLVLAGDSDPIIPVANGRILANRIPRARLEVVEGGHLFLLTHAEEMAARVNAFLDKPVP